MSIPLLLALLIVIVLMVTSRRMLMRKQGTKVQQHFKQPFEEMDIDVPKVQMTTSQGFPHYTVTFADEAQYKLAEAKGLKGQVVAYLRNEHAKIKGYNAEKATVFTWQGRHS